MTPRSVIASGLPAKAWQAGAKQSLWKEVRI